MTDARDLTPEQDAVRRLLADARHDGTTPPEVVTRLDETLTALVSERGEMSPEPQAPVIDLAARRRRRAGVGLLAAAAVVVAGVAVGQGLPQMSGDDSSAGSAAQDEADTSQLPPPDEGDGSDSGAGREPSTESQELAPSAKIEASDVPTLSASDLDLDEDLVDLRAASTYRTDLLGPAQALSGCDLRGIGPGRRVVAEVDGQPGVVVFRRPSGDAQDVAIYVCGDPAPVRTLTLPAP